MEAPRPAYVQVLLIPDRLRTAVAERGRRQQGRRRPSPCVVVDDDDSEREYAYAGASFTDPTAEPILATAARRGWTVVSMADDWARVV